MLVAVMRFKIEVQGLGFRSEPFRFMDYKLSGFKLSSEQEGRRAASL